MDNAQLIQELGNKTNQVEILHGQIKAYADNLDRERRKVAMLTMENQNYQHQFQHLNSPPPPLPPRSSNFVSNHHSLLQDSIILLYLPLAQY